MHLFYFRLLGQRNYQLPRMKISSLHIIACLLPIMKSHFMAQCVSPVRFFSVTILWSDGNAASSNLYFFRLFSLCSRSMHSIVNSLFLPSIVCVVPQFWTWQQCFTVWWVFWLMFKHHKKTFVWTTFVTYRRKIIDGKVKGANRCVYEISAE